MAEKAHPILAEWKAKIEAETLLEPTAIYGYFPCLAEGNTLFSYDYERVEDGTIPADAEPVAQFKFPRQKSNRRLCIADFFLPKEKALAEKVGDRVKVDAFPMQAVTVGEIATEYAQKLFAGDDYTNYLY